MSLQYKYFYWAFHIKYLPNFVKHSEQNNITHIAQDVGKKYYYYIIQATGYGMVEEIFQK